MMPGCLLVHEAGAHTTVQDAGRIGFQDIGVPVSGALDGASLSIANALVGNEPGSGGLEILYTGPTLEVAADSVRVALAGDDNRVEIRNGPSVKAWRSLRLERGQAFRITPTRAAACCYLAVEGGLAIQPCLGSLATYVRGGLGGYEGRALRPGDRLPLERTRASDREERSSSARPETGEGAPIRVVLGPQSEYFSPHALETLTGSAFTVSTSADRMGMRLDGPVLTHASGYDIVSDAIATGAVQVPGSGQPIILLADHQTTGGYPKIATVISADLARVGRRRPGDTLRFEAVDVARAEALGREQHRRLAAALDSTVKLPEVGKLDQSALYRENLVSGVVRGLD